MSANNLYGGTYTMFDAILPQLGIKVKFVNPADPQNFEKAITDKTRAVFVREPSATPCWTSPTSGTIAKVAHAQRSAPDRGRHLHDAVPAAHHRARRGHRGELAHQVDGRARHGDRRHRHRLGQVRLEGQKFALFNEPDPNYHGLRWAHDLPPALAPIAFALRLRTVPLRNLGACISPDNAWMFLQGIETLPLRMDRHCANALAVAKCLKKHPKVDVGAVPGPARRSRPIHRQQVPERRASAAWWSSASRGEGRGRRSSSTA